MNITSRIYKMKMKPDANQIEVCVFGICLRLLTKKYVLRSPYVIHTCKSLPKF